MLLTFTMDANIAEPYGNIRLQIISSLLCPTSTSDFEMSMPSHTGTSDFHPLSYIHTGILDSRGYCAKPHGNIGLYYLSLVCPTGISDS